MVFHCVASQLYSVVIFSQLFVCRAIACKSKMFEGIGVERGSVKMLIIVNREHECNEGGW